MTKPLNGVTGRLIVGPARRGTSRHTPIATGLAAIVAAAGDRADLVDLLHTKQGMVLVRDKAQGILMARRDCSPEEAFAPPTTAAQQNELTVEELSECIVAELPLG